MKFVFSMVGFLALSSAFSPAYAASREVSVCVEVVVQRPPDKAGATGPGTSAKPSPATAPQAPPSRGDNKSESAETTSPTRGDNKSESAEATQSSDGSAPESPPAVPPAPTPPASAIVPPTTLDATASVDPEGSRDPRVQSGAHLPLGQTPEVYLRRLLEHFVTHERGFIAVKQGCEQRIVVDLYPLRLGWTVFARYSGNGREERIDQLLPTELSQFAERSVLALLRDVAITETVDRNNVLWADSLKSTQSIRGRGHVVLGFGSRLRGGRFHTVDESNGATTPQLRLFTPMLMMLGYRGQFEEFGVEAAAEVGIGGSRLAAGKNPGGGHVDYGGSVGASLRAMRYVNVRGLTSLYVGGGATFGLHWFTVIMPERQRSDGSSSTLWSGGLDVDAVLGYELMRASSVSFFLQSEVNLPAYVVRNQNNAGGVNSWFPGAALKLAAIF
ncbi:MAG: hypothetical protein ACOY0T_32070 [Myxococcota bacterium]